MILNYIADAFRTALCSLAMVSIFAGVSLAFSAYTLEYLSENLTRATLDNGLVVLIEENHSHPVTSLQVFVNAGSIYEGDKLGSGLSHLLEHMMFESTARMSKQDIDTCIDQLGGIANASTWRDYASYYLNLPAEIIFDAIPFFAQCIFEARFPEESFLSQQEIIKREIEKSDQESSRLLQKLYYYHAYRSSPIRYPTIGFPDQFLSITLDDLTNYYQRQYVPNNMVLSIVGDFDGKQVLSIVQETFGKYPRKPYNPSTIAEEPNQEGEREVLRASDFNRAYFRLGYRTVTSDDPDAPALSVISAILGEGQASRLIQDIKARLSLVDSISSWAVDMDYAPGSLGISGTCDPQKIDEAIAAVRKDVENLYDTKISDEELDRAKAQIIADEKMGEDTVEVRAGTLAVYQLYYGNPLYSDVFIKQIASVSREDIKRVAKKYLTADRLTIIKLIPSEYMPKTPETSAESPARAQMFTLSNGIRLIVKENHSTPTAVVGVFVLGGLGEEDPQSAGISDLTMHMLLGGAGGKSSGEIAYQVERWGGSFTAGAGTGVSYIKLSILSENLESGVAVLAKCVTKPDFPEKYFSQERERAKNRCLRLTDDWADAGGLKLRANLYLPTHPYSYPFEGKLETIPQLTLYQVKALYKKRFQPQNMVICTVGDVSSEAVQKMMDKYFGKIKPAKEVIAQEPVLPHPDIYAPPSQTTENWKKDLAVVYWGFPTIPYKDPDYFPLLVLDAGFSGIYYPSGPLYQRLRDEGLVYVAHAYHSNLPQGGYFAIYLATARDKVDRAVEIVEEELAKLRAERWSEEMLTVAQEKALSGLNIYYFQSNSDIEAEMAMDELMGKGFSFTDSYKEKVMSVTTEDVQRVAEKYLAPEKETRVVLLPEEEMPMEDGTCGK